MDYELERDFAVLRKLMEERFGEEYRAYCKRTARLVPGIY